MNTDPIRICLQKGWINHEQAISLRTLLVQLPSTDPFSLMQEQEFLSTQQISQLKQELARTQTLTPTSLADCAHLHDYFAYVAQIPGCSDLQLHPGQSPWLRICGQWSTLGEATPLTSFQLDQLGRSFLNQKQISLLEKQKKLTFTYTLADVGRFRIEVVEHNQQWIFSFRILPLVPASTQMLNFPSSIQSFVNLTQGLVLVCGPPASGKSTTLAALLESINEERCARILTLEDPIEYLFQTHRAQVYQIDMGYHDVSWPVMLRCSAKQAFDVIMVSKIDSAQTLAVLLELAQNDCLILAALPAENLADAFGQLIQAFGPDQHPQLRTLLAEVTRGIICQRWHLHDSKQKLFFEVLSSDATVIRQIYSGLWDELVLGARREEVEVTV